MARRPERNFFEQLKRNLPKCGVLIDLQRVENTAVVGTPDVNYCIAGAEGWAELKAWERVRLSGRFTVPKLREDQAIWLSRRGRVGGRCYLLCRINKDVVLIDGRLVNALFDKGLQLDWKHAHLAVNLWLKPPIDWKKLLDALSEPPISQAEVERRLALFGPRLRKSDDEVL